ERREDDRPGWRRARPRVVFPWVALAAGVTVAAAFVSGVPFRERPAAATHRPAPEEQAPSAPPPVEAVVGAASGAASVAADWVEAPWRPSLRFTIDEQWPPGDYLLKLVGSGGQQRHVPLTVRDDSSRAAYLVQNSVTTWQAYNMWGGYDFYYGRSGRGQDYEH